ncbi:hypothetical protein HWV07_08675 [Natronomonas salina]|uniref:hypothetical protein n=1 Tax=Natronomonas salina TaxID=1710540 RepID=UPI0015B71C63|nr:hypothetical protein [Natronomonas salina]QLD89099.1 hypothetical protein HWV07_08675 [Natronomonas salina]
MFLDVHALSISDEEYAEELLEELANSSPKEAQRELNTRWKRFDKGQQALFGRGNIVEVFPADLNPSFLGNLRSRVSNDDDCTVIAGAVDWAESRGKRRSFQMIRGISVITKQK